VLGDGFVQGCDLVHELLALFACWELIGYGGELVSDRQELLCKSVHEGKRPVVTVSTFA
jgi:hypothetical protein